MKELKMSNTQVEQVYQSFESIDTIINDKIGLNTKERSFYVADMSDIHKKYLKWQQLMPRIKPFYAVKCNNLPEIITFLASLGTNFDCASKQEIQQVLAAGVSADKIIYANPCKTNAFIRHAKNVQVNLMTFDNELELHKVAQLHPSAKLVLRIKGDESSSRCKFNMKFGADIDKCYHLLKLAKQLELQVVGVSFHNGSDCLDPSSYEKSIASCRLVFDMGKEIGHNMYMLDIGGGFPGDSKARVSFEAVAERVNKAIETHFPSNSSEYVEIIAEPGRYFVSSSLTLCCMVIAKRAEYDDKSGQNGFMYYLNDGVYSAFNNVIYENAKPEPQLIANGQADRAEQQQQAATTQLYSTVMWGPTCDSIDCIKRDFMFPELQVGQWIMFKDMGAYTCCAASNFNGFELATVIIADDVGLIQPASVIRRSSKGATEDRARNAAGKG